MARPVTDEDRAEVARLHAEGWSLRRIAKEVDRSLSTIQNVAKDLGLKFDGRPTASATQAKQQDNAARRAEIVHRLYERAEFNLDRLEADTYSYTDRIATGIVTEILDHVPAADEKNLITAIGAALASAAKLEAVDAGSGSDHAVSAIGQIGEALVAVARSFESGDSDGA